MSDQLKHPMTAQQYALLTLLFNEQTGLDRQTTEYRIRQDGIAYKDMSIEEIIATARACQGAEENGRLTHIGRGEALNYLHGQREREDFADYGGGYGD